MGRLVNHPAALRSAIRALENPGFGSRNWASRLAIVMLRRQTTPLPFIDNSVVGHVPSGRAATRKSMRLKSLLPPYVEACFLPLRNTYPIRRKSYVSRHMR